MSFMIDEFNKYLPIKRKGGSGWISFDCPCCVAAGESSNDTRGRGGVLYTHTGGVVYHCFNCKTKASWEPGQQLDKNTKFKFVMKNIGIPKDTIRRILFKAFQMRGQIEINQKENPEWTPDWTKLTFSETTLPENSKTFIELISEENPPTEFLEAVNYILEERGETFLEACEYYWSPAKTKSGTTLKNRVIIPFYWRDKIVGWNARLVSGNGQRYYGDIPSNYLFNNKIIDDRDRLYIILVEGLFDAIAIDGVGACGGTLTKEQIQWLNSGGHEIIVCPDRNKAGNELVEIAIKEGWSVSFPRNKIFQLWEEDIEDVADATKRYGRIYTLRSILKGKTTDKTQIKTNRKFDLEEIKKIKKG